MKSDVNLYINRTQGWAKVGEPAKTTFAEKKKTFNYHFGCDL